jgi:hypothetical protein
MGWCENGVYLIIPPFLAKFHGGNQLRAGKSPSNGSIIFLSTKIQLIALAMLDYLIKSHEIPLNVIASSKITMRRWEKHLGLGISRV